jgi:hypothetical protein
MAQAEILRVVVASPGDVQAERNTLPQIIEELNRGIAAERGVMLVVSRWETDAYPGFHAEGPQGLIDPILKIEDCDIFIGIFWKRFGTPVSEARSGTEHEFRRAHKAWKKEGKPQIMFYFSQRPFRPQSADEVEQLARVLEFQRGFPKEGLWWRYRNKAEFEKLVRNHLTNFIRSREADEDESNDQEQEVIGRHSETTVLRGDEYEFHNYYLSGGNAIAINMTSDEIVDVLIMDKRDFKRWDGEDEVPSYYRHYQDKTSLNTSFVVPKDYEYYVVFWNRSEDEATVELEIEIWG